MFAAVCGGLLAFGNNFKDDLILGSLIESRTGRYTLLALLFYSGLLFVFTWWREQMQAAHAEWLSTTSGRRLVLARVLEEPLNKASEPGEALSFSFSDVVDAIVHRPTALSPFSIFSGGLSASSAERLAQMHMDELERQGVLRKASDKRVDVRYEIDYETARDAARRR